MQNTEELFGIALGLKSPWKIKSVDFNEDKILNIEICFERGYKFTMLDGKSYSAYDTVARSWEHLNFFQHRCFIHCKVPRIKQSDGKIITQPVPWARKGSGFTLLFEAYAMLLIEKEMPVNKVGELLKVYPNRIWTIFNHWIGLSHQEREIKDLKKIGFDETSTQKGHNYITTTVDLEKRNVLFAVEGKDSACIKKSVLYLSQKDVDIKNIEQVCIDMSPSFISGCQENLPHAAITFDKFHVMKEVNAAMDELRRLERKGNELLKGHKYTFLKRQLTCKKEQERAFLMELFPKLGEGYRLVEMFRDFWDIEDKEEANAYLSFWCDFVEESGIFPFKKVVKTIKAHWSGILNYIESRINNGILEGINSKIQLAKKRARGYRNTNNFINMIYFIAGKLKFNYPLFLT